MNAIRTIDDICDRCRVDEETGCWAWALARNTDGQPKCEAILPGGRRIQSTAGRVAWMLAHGHELGRGRVVYRPVGCSEVCCNPYTGHLRVGTKAQAGAHLAKSGHLRGNPLRSFINRRNRWGAAQSDALVSNPFAQLVRLAA